MNTPQKDVFEYSIKSIVDGKVSFSLLCDIIVKPLNIVIDVTAGYNGTVFAYGQTGSGKTFTMMVKHLII